jgi:hypothetical protein
LSNIDTFAAIMSLIHAITLLATISSFWRISVATNDCSSVAPPRSPSAIPKPATADLAFLPKQSKSSSFHPAVLLTARSVRGGASLVPAGWNPWGYTITETGKAFLAFGGSESCDVGRFLASLKSGRKRRSTLKAAWLEIVRHAKTGQAMRIYRNIDELLKFCLKTGMIN